MSKPHQEPTYSAAHYSQLHRKFLERQPGLLAEMRQANPDLTSYLSSVGKEAEELHTTLMMQRQQSPQYQSLPYPERVKDLQAFRHEADETVRHQLINQPLPPPATA
jgi:hypothetical protein